MPRRYPLRPGPCPGPCQALAPDRSAGLVHAGFSLYWALGGRSLLPTLGEWAVVYALAAPLSAALVLLVVTAVKGVVALAPAVLWDPLFLVWGLLLGAGLWVTRRSLQPRPVHQR